MEAEEARILHEAREERLRREFSGSFEGSFLGSFKGYLTRSGFRRFRLKGQGTQQAG